MITIETARLRIPDGPSSPPVVASNPSDSVAPVDNAVTPIPPGARVGTESALEWGFPGGESISQDPIPPRAAPFVSRGSRRP